MAEAEGFGWRTRSRTPVWRESEPTRQKLSGVPESWRAEAGQGRDCSVTGAATAGLGRGEVAELERELEREMRQLLREQNTGLQLQVQALTKGKGSSAGSTQVREQGESDDPDPGARLRAPPPPPRTPPASVRNMYYMYTVYTFVVIRGPVHSQRDSSSAGPAASKCTTWRRAEGGMAEILATVEFRCGRGQVGEWPRNEGWMVRYHAKSQHYSFNPLHSTCPCSRLQLRGRRVSIIIHYPSCRPVSS